MLCLAFRSPQEIQECVVERVGECQGVGDKVTMVAIVTGPSRVSVAIAIVSDKNLPSSLCLIEVLTAFVTLSITSF